MNWKELLEEKAYYSCVLLSEHLHKNTQEQAYVPVLYLLENETNYRILFDFFDSKGIYVCVSISLITEKWMWLISYDKGLVKTTNKGQESRKLAEELAFEAAFLLLEERLLSMIDQESHE